MRALQEADKAIRQSLAKFQGLVSTGADSGTDRRSTVVSTQVAWCRLSGRVSAIVTVNCSEQGNI